MFRVVLFSLVALVWGQSEVLQNEDHHRQICAGIYSAEDYPGDFNSEVQVVFKSSQEESVSVVVFAYEDIDTLGVDATDQSGRPIRKYLCDQPAIHSQLCSEEDYGKVIINKYGSQPKMEIYSEKIDLPHKDPIVYNVTKTDYYCVVTFPLASNPSKSKYKATVHFMNAYGHVPGGEHALLWYPGVMFLVYLLFAIAWTFLFVRYRQDVLPVQQWITFVVAYMLVEQSTLWGYYRYFNAHGETSGVTKFLLALVAILGAGRLSLTFFLLLIVCLGYSVVYERLGPKLKWCRILAGVLFVCAALYSLDSYYIVPSDENGLVQFFFFFPTVLSMAIFYVWILQALGETKNYLMARKQFVKARMYRNLWWILLGSAIAIFGFFILSTLVQSTQRLRDIINNYWKTKWLLNYGWPNFVYLVAFAMIAFIWRPTGNNRRFAMSSQLAQDENDAEEFEIGSLNGSDDENEELNPVPQSPPQNTSGLTRTDSRGETVFEADRDSPAVSDINDSDDARSDHWNRNEDEDTLVSAPSGQIKNK